MGKKQREVAAPMRCLEKKCISRDVSCNKLDEGFDYKKCSKFMTMDILEEASRPVTVKICDPGKIITEDVKKDLVKVTQHSAYDAVKKIGGKMWYSKEGDKHRAYFNQPLLSELYGILVTVKDLYVYDKSIVSATVNGEPITNDEAINILHELRNAKIWYDFDAGGVRYRRNSPILATIAKKIEVLVNPAHPEKNPDTS